MKNRFLLQKSSTLPDGWVLTDTTNNVVIRFTDRKFNETQKCDLLDDSAIQGSDAQRLATVLSEMGDWMVRYHSDICFDTPFGIQYSEDDETMYLYRSKFPRWKIEIQDSVYRSKLAASLNKAAEWLNKK